MHLNPDYKSKRFFTALIIVIMTVLSVFSRGMLMHTMYFLTLAFYSAFDRKRKFFKVAAFLAGIDLFGSFFNELPGIGHYIVLSLLYASSFLFGRWIRLYMNYQVRHQAGAPAVPLALAPLEEHENAALSDAQAGLLASVNLKELLVNIAELARINFHCDTISINIFNGDTYSSGFSNFREEVRNIGRVESEMYSLLKLKKDYLHFESVDFLYRKLNLNNPDKFTRAAVAVPLKKEDVIYGFTVFYFDSPEPGAAELSAFAAHVSDLVWIYHRYGLNEKDAEFAAVLYDAIKTFIPRLNDLCGAVFEEFIKKALPGKKTALYTYAGGVPTGPDGQLGSYSLACLGMPKVIAALAGRKPILLSSVSGPSPDKYKGNVPENIYIVPLFFNGELKWAATVEGLSGGQGVEGSIRLIDNVRTLFETFSLLSERLVSAEKNRQRDETTGGFNFQHFLKNLKNLVNFAKLGRSFFGLVIIDIDGFFFFNEACGYEEGNKILHKTSKILSKYSEGGPVFRYNGDNFVLLFENKPEEFFEETISRALEELTNGVFYQDVSGKKIKLRFKASYASYPHTVKSPDYVFPTAEKCIKTAEIKETAEPVKTLA